ncbi:MAG TPA: hypothetical protein OIL93_02460 [Oscillospiraceae bacterium]|nr:hypothetical protein [Oscillospiraceae bacterium]
MLLFSFCASKALEIRHPLKYSMLCHDFDEVISFARNDGEVHFAQAEQK